MLRVKVTIPSRTLLILCESYTWSETTRSLVYLRGDKVYTIRGITRIHSSLLGLESFQ